MVRAPALRRARRALRALTAALLLPTLAACGADGDALPVQGTVAPPNSAQGDWLPADLEGEWRGWSFPTAGGGLPVLLTLGFEALGTDPEDVALTRYTFPAPGGYATINYLALLSGYSARFEADGDLELDTEMVVSGSYGSVTEERIWKDLQMSADGRTLAGREDIVLTTWSGGLQTQQFLSYWLTLTRLD